MVRIRAMGDISEDRSCPLCDATGLVADGSYCPWCCPEDGGDDAFPVASGRRLLLEKPPPSDPTLSQLAMKGYTPSRASAVPQWMWPDRCNRSHGLTKAVTESLACPSAFRNRDFRELRSGLKYLEDEKPEFTEFRRAAMRSFAEMQMPLFIERAGVSWFVLAYFEPWTRDQGLNYGGGVFDLQLAEWKVVVGILSEVARIVDVSLLWREEMPHVFAVEPIGEEELEARVRALRLDTIQRFEAEFGPAEWRADPAAWLDRIVPSGDAWIEAFMAEAEIRRKP